MIDAQKFATWIREVQGQYINMDFAYGAQCWDLHAHFADWFVMPRVNTGYAGRWVGWAGNMFDAYPQNDAISAAYERVPGHLPAEPGDTAIWDDSFWYYPKTHVAQVVRDGPQLLCMSQNSTPSQADNPYPNWSTGPTTLQHLPKGGLLGYLRPRGTITAQAAPTTTPVEEDMSKEQFEILSRKLDAAIEHSHRAAQVANGIEDSGVRAKVSAIYEMVSDLNEAYKYLRGPDDLTLYEFTGGKLRGITKAEWDAKGNPEPRRVPADLIATLKKGS